MLSFEFKRDFTHRLTEIKETECFLWIGPMEEMLLIEFVLTIFSSLRGHIMFQQKEKELQPEVGQLIGDGDASFKERILTQIKSL